MSSANNRLRKAMFGKRNRNLVSPHHPKDGDTVVMCEHCTGAGDGEWHGWAGEWRFRQPLDGSTGIARHLIACDRCYKAADGNPFRIAIRGSGEWMGDTPIFYLQQ